MEKKLVSMISSKDLVYVVNIPVVVASIIIKKLTVKS